MVGTMAHETRPQATDFEVLADETAQPEQNPPLDLDPPSSLDGNASTVLEELPVAHQTPATRRHPIPSKLQGPGSPDGTPNSKLPIRIQKRRPPVDTQALDPLTLQEKVPACPEWKSQPDCSAAPAVQSDSTCVDDAESKGQIHYDHTDCPIEYQVKKQLAGQFDWIITYPAPEPGEPNGNARLARQDGVGDGKEPVTFGCNLLRRAWRTNSTGNHEDDGNADRYTLIATPLKENNASLIPLAKEPRKLEQQVTMALSQHLSPSRSASVNTRETEATELVTQAVSPALSHVSDMSGSFTSHRDGTLAVPRIEDSLEELDNLEDQLEAVTFVTSSGRTERKKSARDVAIPFPNDKPTPDKQATINFTQSATTRVKGSDKIRPALQRSNSLRASAADPARLHDVHEQKAAGPSLKQTKPATGARSTDSRPMVKSTKPLTVPKFELPGEVVSRRLKEQREARQAQQAEAQKAQAAPARPRSSKPLTKPKFELPGEAISRRKREEHEARLKAQEEEERKKREFKARPIRYSLTPTTLPRDTVTSRARQGKQPAEEDLKNREAIQAKRLSMHAPQSHLAATSSASARTSQVRGRHSMVRPFEDAARTASVSTSVSDKRSSVSLEDIACQKARGREIYTRDSCYSRDYEREKREREAAAKSARELAAERSRAASREWAEKKRQRERAMKGVTAGSGGRVAVQ